MNKERFINLNMKFDPEIGKILMKINKQDKVKEDTNDIRIGIINPTLPTIKMIPIEDKNPEDEIKHLNPNLLSNKDIPIS